MGRQTLLQNLCQAAWKKARVAELNEELRNAKKQMTAVIFDFVRVFEQFEVLSFSLPIISYYHSYLLGGAIVAGIMFPTWEYIYTYIDIP